MYNFTPQQRTLPASWLNFSLAVPYVCICLHHLLSYLIYFLYLHVSCPFWLIRFESASILLYPRETCLRSSVIFIWHLCVSHMYPSSMLPLCYRIGFTDHSLPPPPFLLAFNILKGVWHKIFDFLTPAVNCSAVSMTPAKNLSPMSTTLAINPCHREITKKPKIFRRCQRHRRKTVHRCQWHRRQIIQRCQWHRRLKSPAYN
jgi:hypothetical protein